MQTRRQSRLQVSALGLGCIGMSEFYGTRDDNQAIADLYGIGHNEEILARAVRDAGDLVIATKFGVVRGPDGPFSGSTGGPTMSARLARLVCAVSVLRCSTSIISTASIQ